MLCNDGKEPELPDRWQAIEADQVYYSKGNQLVSFSQAQIQLGLLYDAPGKHLKAIHKGIVSPKGNTGLVPSQETNYDFKSKILGKGGDRRFHAKIVGDVLHFPGKMTTH
jgi:hypothetical protein